MLDLETHRWEPEGPAGVDGPWLPREALRGAEHDLGGGLPKPPQLCCKLKCTTELHTDEEIAPQS